MIRLSDKFNNVLTSAEKTPSYILKIRDDELIATETSQADWTANSSESNVDYALVSGDVQLAQQTHTLDIIKVIITGAAGYTVRMQLYESDKTTTKGTAVDVVAPSDGWNNFDFSSQSLTMTRGTKYWFKVITTTNPIGSPVASYQTGDPYPYGQCDTLSLTNIGDLTFEVSYTDSNIATESQLTANTSAGIKTANFVFQSFVVNGDIFEATGNITTQTIDLGSVPTNNGVFTVNDTIRDNTSITYEAWHDSTGAFSGSETSIGIITAGTELTDLVRYWRVKATLATEYSTVSPSVRSIGMDFSTYKSWTDSAKWGYDISLKSISSFSSTIDDFKESSIGKITATLALTDDISDWFFNNVAKGRLVKVLVGFDDNTFTEEDFINYFWGTIENVTIDKLEVKLSINDFQSNWNKNIPEKWESAADNITWTAQHPIDVMTDILTNSSYLNLASEKVDTSGFDAVKTALSGWFVTRTITNSPVEAKKLLNELRIITNTYFILKEDGSVTLKRYDETEAPSAIFTMDNMISHKVDYNYQSVINDISTYFDWDGDGDNESDFGSLTVDVDATSLTDYKYKQKVIKDKWTLAAQSAQVDTSNGKYITRYATPPRKIDIKVDARFLYLEIGDITSVVTHRAFRDASVGNSSIYCQIVSKALDFKTNTINFKLLEI